MAALMANRCVGFSNASTTPRNSPPRSGRAREADGGVLSPEAIERTRRLQIRYQLAPAKQKSERLRPVTRATAAMPHTNNTSEASSRTRVARKPAVPPASQCREPVSCPRKRGHFQKVRQRRIPVCVFPTSPTRTTCYICLFYRHNNS
jgi:hypothetical protein